MRVELRGWVVPASVGTISFGAGIGVGYFIAKFKQRKKEIKEPVSNEDLESRITEVQFAFEEYINQFAAKIQQANKVIDNFREACAVLIENYNANTEQIERDKEDHPSKTRTLTVLPNEEDDTMRVRVFTEEDDDWDYEVEVPLRTATTPYIIHRDEYFSNELDYGQSSLMYYEGDNILCDELDVPIYNPEKIVGQLIFGHGSRDPNICYVRNEALLAEYEVLRDHGSFMVEVLGQQIERTDDIKHSRGVPKFRDE